MDFFITRPKLENSKEIAELFKVTLTELYQREGIIDSHPDLLKFEYKDQCSVLNDFLSRGDRIYDFLIAKDNTKIIGTSAVGKANSIIKDNLEFNYKKTPEIKSVYILPGYQSRSVGKLLFTKAILSLNKKGYENFCLDCGYQQSQSYWMKRLGEPANILSDYWGAGMHHMIWFGKTSDF